MFKHCVLAAGLVALLAHTPAQAGEAGDILRGHLYAGTLADGLAALAPLADRGDAEARFGLGFLKFFTGVEHLTQSLYRHGLVAPDTGPLDAAISVPIPVNPNPEMLTYDKVRAVLETLVADMDAARDALVEAGEGGDYVVLLDPLQFRVDIDGDGTVSEAESVAGILATQFGADFTQASPAEPEGDRRKNIAQPADASVGFDRADAIWMAGYSQVFAAHGDFFLAHDFADLVNSAFHRLFPRAGLPMQDYAGSGTLMMDPMSDAAMSDLIAAIHSLNMKVIEPERLAHVLVRLKSITAFSRRNWAAILSEIDDNRELVPSPTQTSIIPDGVVTQEIVDAWLATLDTADRILDGQLLVPHWRFKQGFDIKAYFEQATRTDLVMLLTGYDALPFLKEGPVADAASFAQANRVFGDNLLGYAFWFN